MMRKAALGTAVAILVFGVVAGAEANVLTLSDRNSSVQIDVATQEGVLSWVVDGVNHNQQQWYWFRVGNDNEASIDTLPLVGFLAVDTNPSVDPANDTLSVRYGSASTFFIDLSYTLGGGAAGSFTANLAQAAEITNNSGSPLDIHLFQYTDLSIGGTAGGDTAVLINPNTVLVSGDGPAEIETVETPASDHYELAFSPASKTKLNDAASSSLDDGPTVVGPGDVTWAFQWDRVMAPSSSFAVSKSMSSRSANSPPVATDDTATAVNGIPVTVNVLFNDSDPNGDTLSVTGVSQGTNGTVTNNGNGTVTYDPVCFQGMDSFTYTIDDGVGGTDAGMVTVRVRRTSRRGSTPCQ